jgi:hypothetical protein
VSVSTTANTVTLAAVSTSLADVKEKHSNLKLGANWTASQFFTARAEAFTKDHENRFSGYGTSAGSLYVLNYDIYGARISAIVKPVAMVTSTTRYVVQRGKAGTIGNVYSSTSGDSRRYQISETIDWNPTRSFYTQLNANLVYDTIVTSEPYVTGASKIVVYNADNNYWNGHALCGFVVDKDTNAEVQFTYYRADNYVPAQSIGTIPYGMGAKDYTLAFGVKHRFSDRWVGNAKVGYTDSRNDTAGGNSDYRGPLGYFSVDYKL